MFENPDVSEPTVPSSVEDAVTLNARHSIQMWQHLRRALEEFCNVG